MHLSHKKFNFLGVHTQNLVWPGVGLTDKSDLSSSSSSESLTNEIQMDSDHNEDELPLFLQLNCSIHSKSSLATTAVKLFPTCFNEITKHLEDFDLTGDTKGLKITLDMICLNLPKEVLEVSLEHSPGLRKTSYCSASSSMRTENDSSFGNDKQSSEMEHLYEGMQNLPTHQYAAVSNLIEEIHWLLRDEITTALLDKPLPVSEETLKYVAKHVSVSSERSSCYLDKVPLHFVYSSENSVPKFLEELGKLRVDRYSICQEERYYYFTKNEPLDETREDIEDSFIYEKFEGSLLFR